MKWDDLMRGPSLAEVRRHVRKVANFPKATPSTRRGR
jgi:hypothetical protein